MIIHRITVFAILFLSLYGCSTPEETTADLPQASALDQTQSKLSELLAASLASNKIPRTEEGDGNMVWASKTSESGEIRFDWTLGFFPGSCWYLYEYTEDEKWKEAAEKFQSQFRELKDFEASHDLGFVFQCSYGNGFRISQNEEYKQVLIDAGNSLLTRFNPTIGCIQSWDVDAGWQAKRGWKFPVIIDNMMNLEMLFELTKMTGDEKYREVAIAHADNTLANHFRADHSSYHVVDYDPETGKVRKKCTAQGFADESAWARGQAWGLYGYVVCYRYTNNPVYLDQAIRIADFIINHPALPEDGIPYWDYQAPNIPNEPRDVSAAAVTASALIELNQYTGDQYAPFVEKVMKSLSSDRYMVPLGDKTQFVLDHSVGSIPHGNEIDEPLVYADYYYLEALMRLHEFEQTTASPVVAAH